MVTKTDFFWTDINQAVERLTQTVVMYDGEPVFIREVLLDSNPPKASVYFFTDGSTKTKLLSSPKFNRFRTLPALGWMNPVDTKKIGINAMFMNRRVISTRSHGLSSNNVVVYCLMKDSNEFSSGRLAFNNVYDDPGFLHIQTNQYPTLASTLQKIEDSSVIAYSPLFAVFRDNRGIRWLYRNLEPVGIFTGADTLNLLQKYSYLREEIMADPAFTCNNIREL